MLRSTARILLITGLITLVIAVVIGAKVFSWTVPHNGAIEKASEQKIKFDSLDSRASKLSLSCWPRQAEECQVFIGRADRNPSLRVALLRAKAKGVSIYLRDWLGFGTNAGWVYVDPKRSDKSIIDFLVGTQEIWPPGGTDGPP